MVSGGEWCIPWTSKWTPATVPSERSSSALRSAVGAGMAIAAVDPENLQSECLLPWLGSEVVVEVECAESPVNEFHDC